MAALASSRRPLRDRHRWKCMNTPGTVERPLCVAVIGSGPSGFYATEALLKASNLTVRVDLFDRSPTPFGLARGGWAPDPKIKAVTAGVAKVAVEPPVRSLC